jgi:fructokinase
MVGSGPENILAEKRIPTTNPEDTLLDVIEFFKPFKDKHELIAVGIASFGPIDLNLDSQSYGHITTTPKKGWNNVDLYGQIKHGLNVPIAFETDVNAAAYGEQYWKKEGKNLDPFLYITIGTGIGVGVIINGVPLHGLMHAEAGHSSIPHDKKLDPFQGVCPYHGDCLEGLASGYSMLKRWGKAPETLADNHPGWELESEYLGMALVNLIYAYSPRQIIIGGGVSQHEGLIQSVRSKVVKFNKGYIQSERMTNEIEDYIQLPSLGTRSGALGAIALAINLAKAKDR